MRDFDSSSNSISKPERYRGNYRCELLNKQPPDGHILCIFLGCGYRENFFYFLTFSPAINYFQMVLVLSKFCQIFLILF